MAGWTAAGDRPEFQIVIGVSTGALSAPFVFLGPEYDGVLRDIYLTHGTDDLLEFRPWTVIATGDAAIDTDKLHELITGHLDEKLIRRAGGSFNIMEPEEQLDRKYMKVLFDIGYGLAARGMKWDSIPPTAGIQKID